MGADRSAVSWVLAFGMAAVFVACSSSREAPMDANAPPDGGGSKIQVAATSFTNSLVLGHSVHTVTDDLDVSADAAMQWQVTASDPWIAVPQSTFMGHAHVSLVVDAAHLEVGTYVGHATVASVADPADSVVVTVTLGVKLPPLILSPSPLVIGGNDGLDAADSQPLTITLETGDNAWPWTASLTGTWLSMAAMSGTASAVPQPVMATADRAALTAGRYMGSVRIDAVVDGVTVSNTVDVTFNKEGHWLYVSSLGVAFSSFPGRSMLTRTLHVLSSQGRTDVAWAAQSDADWLAVTPSGSTGGSLVLTANPAGLTPDHEYIGNVTVTASDPSITNQQHVRVGLWIGSVNPAPVSLSGSYSHVTPGPVEPYAYTSGGADRVLVYHVYTGELVNTFTSVVTQAGAMAINGDGTVLYVNDDAAHQIVAVDARTGADLQHIPERAVFFGELSYARPNAQPVLLLPDGTVYDLTTGATSSNGVIGGGEAVDPLDRSVYVQDTGTSPSSLARYSMSYTVLSTPQFVSHPAVSVMPGSNGGDVCVSSDGARVYSANGSPYMFLVFNAMDLTPLPALAGDAYPDNTGCGWNGLFVGGLSGVGSQVWAYRPDGSLVTTLLLHPGSGNELTPRTLRLSGDNTRLMGATDGFTPPNSTFNIVDAPSP